jgi:hypothetical protein
LHELVDLASAIEQRIIGVAMQVDKGHRALRLLARGRLFIHFKLSAGGRYCHWAVDDNGSMRPADTSPEAWAVLTSLQRQMPPSEKMQLAFEWSEMIRQFAEAGLREKYPHASEREIFLRLARQRLGEELFLRVYGSELGDDAAACQNI